MLAAYYKTKKELKENKGNYLNYGETSIFGAEYKSDGKFCVVGPSEYKRNWFATVTMEKDKIKSVT